MTEKRRECDTTKGRNVWWCMHNKSSSPFYYYYVSIGSIGSMFTYSILLLLKLDCTLNGEKLLKESYEESRLIWWEDKDRNRERHGNHRLRMSCWVVSIRDVCQLRPSGLLTICKPTTKKANNGTFWKTWEKSVIRRRIVLSYIDFVLSRRLPCIVAFAIHIHQGCWGIKGYNQSSL